MPTTNGRGRSLGRPAFSLLEALAVVAILSVIAVVALSRFSGASATVKKNSCYTLKGNIEVQSQLWYRNKGVWPAANLADIAGDASYLPEGLPICPVDGTSYTFNQSTHKVTGHTH